MNTTYKFLPCALFLAIISILSFAGCSETAAVRGSKMQQTTPKFHVWDSLTEKGKEKDGYALYTYVIFRDEERDSTKEIGRRYEGLLDAIMSTISTPQDAEEYPKKESNIFYIPYNTHLSKRPAVSPLKDYNFSLARKYIAHLRKAIEKSDTKAFERLDSKPGPFLISLRYPLGKTKGDITTLLFADLSSRHPAAMKEVVAAYKQRISSKPIDEAQQFEPIRLALLNLILNTNDYIEIVKAASAELVPGK